MQPADFIALVRDALAADPSMTHADATRAAWSGLTIEQRLQIADRVPECGHGLAEVGSGLAHLEREIVTFVERRGVE